ncbi:hypothetical protein [Myroides sp.]|uniref:hypothetical protein n=1 Tax=Myroides sp. TaxID=1874736 RepID=UPI003F410ECA
MKEKCYIILLVLFSLISNAQQINKVSNKDVTDIISYTEYVEIKQFILDQRKRRTYCNMYNDNPFYEFKDSIEVYLDPSWSNFSINLLDKIEEWDYSKLVIRKWELSDHRLTYINVTGDNENKRMYLHMDYYNTEEVVSLAKQVLKDYVRSILEEIKEKNNKD